jgi:predicted CopG family antitoxin
MVTVQKQTPRIPGAIRSTHKHDLTVSNANKRIPVTEERWTELNDLKEAGQTYDDLLEELIREHRRRQLADHARTVREADSEELTPLDEL